MTELFSQGWPVALAPIEGPLPTYAFALPLVAVISLVYAATRYESFGKIGAYAFKVFFGIVGIMAAATGLLMAMHYFV